jgi:hypothetical protein
MSTNERDTKFAGFAELLYEDLKRDIAALFVALGSPLASRGEEIERSQQLLKQTIAQRAYDLVEYVLRQFPVPHTPGGVRDSISWLQDMDVWPERERFANALADLAKIESKLPEKSSDT